MDLINVTKKANFTAGQSFVDVSFTYLDDSIPEDNEIFGVHLVSSPGVYIGTPSIVQFTIIDDDCKLIIMSGLCVTVTTTITAVTSHALTQQSHVHIQDTTSSISSTTSTYTEGVHGFS